MKLPITLYLLLACVLVNSCKKNTIDDQSTVFIKYFGSAKSSEGFDLKQTPDGGYILVGSTSVKDTEVKNVLIVKTDAKGNQQWIKTFGDKKNAEAKSVQLTPDGGYAVVGYYNSGSSTVADNDIYLIKLDANGNTIYTKTPYAIAGSNQEGASLQVASDGNFYIVGSSDEKSLGKRDIVFIKTNSFGESTWINKENNDTEDDYPNDLEMINDTSFFIVSTTNSQNQNQSGKGGYDIYPYKTYRQSPSNGSPVLELKLQPYPDGAIGTLVDDIGASSKKLSNTDVILLGNVGNSIFLVKIRDNKLPTIDIPYAAPDLEPIGEIPPISKDGGSLSGKDIDLTKDGGFIIAGNYTSGSNTDQYLLKTDGSGNKIWEKTFGSTDTDVANAVIATSDGGYAFIGSTTLGGYSVMTLVKVTATGELKK